MKSGRQLSRWEWAVALVMLALVTWMILNLDSQAPRTAAPSPSPDKIPAAPLRAPTASERLLEGYADPATLPIEDLKKIHRVATGYFSVVKDASRFPIGGNADLAAALRGENPNREVFVAQGHPAFSKDGLLLDRWGTPLVVHPEAWKQLELRSAGPDKLPYTPDDLVLEPSGMVAE